MRTWRVLMARLSEFLRKTRVERELSEELDHHIAMLTEEYERRGLTPDQAQTAARREFGGVDRAREAVRDARGFRPLEVLVSDGRYAVRLLLKTPGFTIAAVATLGLGIGANSAIFSLVDAAMLRPLPYAAPDRLVALWEMAAPPDGSGAPERIAVAPANLADYKSRAKSLVSVAAYSSVARNLTGSGTPERIFGEEVSASYFDTLGIAPALGRPIQPEDQLEGAEPVVLISDPLWSARFGADPSVLGRTVVLDSVAHRIIGVLPRDFRGPTEATRLDPVSFVAPLILEAAMLANRHEHIVEAVGRLAPGVSLDTARAELASVSEGLGREFPETASVRAAIAPLGDDQARDARPLLVVLFTAVALVLLIACVNVAALLVVRSIARQREIAVRFALGATRLRVIRELVVQSLVLAALGAAAGLAFGAWTLDVLISLAPATLPHLADVTMSSRVFFYTACLALGTGVVFGLLPALQVSRTKPTEVLRAQHRGNAGWWTMRSRNVLMLVEVVLSTILLVAAGLMIRSSIALNEVELGFDPENVLAMTTSLPIERYPTPDSRLMFFEDLAARAANIPGVRSVAFGNRLPVRGSWISGFLLESAEGPARASTAASAGFQAVSPGYFDVLRMRLVSGRALSNEDRTGTTPVAVVSEQFSREFLQGRSPIGQRIQRGPSMPWITIVGVVNDVRRDGRTADIASQVYLPAAQTQLYPLRLSELAVRAEAAPPALISALQDAVWSIDRDQPVVNVRTLEETLALRVASRRFQTFLFLMFAGLALTLAAIGIYGVVAYAVSQRTAEIGLRMALGADGGRILRWLAGQSLRLIAAGTIVGLGAALLLARYVESLLFGVSPTDPAAYVGAALVLGVAALTACLAAARRATRVDPLDAIR